MELELQEEKWMPILLVGKIKKTNGMFHYFYQKKRKSSFDTMEEALQAQEDASLLWKSSNCYRSCDNGESLQIKVCSGSDAWCDAEDLPLIKNKLWHVKKGKPCSKSNEEKKTLSMAHHILNSRMEEKIHYLDGNPFNNRRCNIVLMSSFLKRKNHENHENDKEEDDKEEDDNRKENENYGKEEISCVKRIPTYFSKKSKQEKLLNNLDTLENLIIDSNNYDFDSNDTEYISDENNDENISFEKDKQTNAGEMIERIKLLHGPISSSLWSEIIEYSKTKLFDLDYFTGILSKKIIPYWNISMISLNGSEEELLQETQRLLQCDYSLLSSKIPCSKVTWKFFSEAMLHCKKKSIPTFPSVMENESNIKSLLKTLIRLKMKTCDFLRAYKLSFYFVSNFVPSIAKTLYDKEFLPEIKEKKVLDLCSGFGGRFLGFWSSSTCKEYIGIDPNPRLVECYENMTLWLKSSFPKITKNKIFEFNNECAEDIDYEKRYGRTFDIVFTSPPYYDAEIYGEEKEQSCFRYKDFISWKKEFLYETLYKASKAVKPNGIIAINIKDVKEKNKTVLSICEPMISFMNSIDWILDKTLILPVSKRPGKYTESNESIFVFKNLKK